MRCPFCQHTKTKVVDSREAGPETRRRRECLQCDKRFTTFERVEQVKKLVVIKKDRSRVPFDRDKLLTGIERACFKRPIPQSAIEQLVTELEEDLFYSGREEVTTEHIGNLVADRLRDLDHVAYVRFASVYRDFRDADDIAEALEELKNNDPRPTDQDRLF